jgi:hypothetical protein
MYDNYNYAISNAGLPSNEMKLDVSGHGKSATLPTFRVYSLLICFTQKGVFRVEYRLGIALNS